MSCAEDGVRIQFAWRLAEYSFKSLATGGADPATPMPPLEEVRDAAAAAFAKLPPKCIEAAVAEVSALFASREASWPSGDARSG